MTSIRQNTLHVISNFLLAKSDALYNYQDEFLIYCGLWFILQAQKMEKVFFLSFLPNELCDKVLSILQKYGKLGITGQRAKTKDLKAGLKNTVDCPIYHFKCLRGDLTDDKISELLDDVEKCKRTFMELKQEASRIKEVKEVQRQFIAKTGCKNWVEVTER